MQMSVELALFTVLGARRLLAWMPLDIPTDPKVDGRSRGCGGVRRQVSAIERCSSVPALLAAME